MIQDDVGGPEGIRTPDLLHAMEARFQLRYRPMHATEFLASVVDAHSLVRANGRSGKH